MNDLAFECNRFDFDCELVAKLALRGFIPLEIPVNYTSRSFKAGKKISFFSDPPTYVRSFLKYRFVDPATSGTPIYCFPTSNTAQLLSTNSEEA